MKTRISLSIAFLSLVTILFCCKSPLDNVELTVDTNILHYTALVQVNSSAGADLSNATVTISGADAAKIYNLEGRKSFKVAGGVLGLAVNPSAEPTASAPVKFSVTISAPGHLSINFPVTITEKQKGNTLQASLVSTANPPAGVAVETRTVALSATGAITAPISLSTTASANVPEATSMTLSAGTQFKNAADQVIVSSQLSVTTVSANAGTESAVNVFPGGGLSQPAVKTSTGTVAGTLLPAGFTEISMTAGTSEVKTFTQPVQVGMQLDDDFINPTTGAKVKAGDVVAIYSYSVDKAIWEFESNATVAASGSKLVANFPTTHLTWFMSGSFAPACTTPLNITINASWLSNGTTHPVTAKIYTSGRDKLVKTTNITATNGTTLAIESLPQQNLVAVFYDVDGNELSSNNLTSCSTSLTATLAASPTANNAKVTMQLYVRCPGNANTVTLLPTFYLYYKETGSTGDYKLLGIVEKGYISTTLLNTTKRYDFKSVWGNTIKIVNNKAVTADNSGTVGTQPSDLIGTINGAVNLGILTEKCKENGY